MRRSILSEARTPSASLHHLRRLRLIQKEEVLFNPQALLRTRLCPMLDAAFPRLADGSSLRDGDGRSRVRVVRSGNP